MISLEQVRQLDIRVKKAVAAVKVLSNENTELKRRIAELESERNNLKQQVTDQKADEQQLEVSLQGVLDILDEVNEETADIEPEPPEENYSIETIDDSEVEAVSESDRDEDVTEEILDAEDTVSGEATVLSEETPPAATEEESDSSEAVAEKNIDTEDSPETDTSESTEASVEESVQPEDSDTNPETEDPESNASEPEAAIQMSLTEPPELEIPPTGLELNVERSGESADLELSGTEIDPSDVEAGFDGPSISTDMDDVVPVEAPAAAVEKQEGIIVEVPTTSVDAEPTVEMAEEVDLESETDEVGDSSDDDQFQSEFDIF